MIIEGYYFMTIIYTAEQNLLTVPFILTVLPTHKNYDFTIKTINWLKYNLSIHSNYYK